MYSLLLKAYNGTVLRITQKHEVKHDPTLDCPTTDSSLIVFTEKGSTQLLQDTAKHRAGPVPPDAARLSPQTQKSKSIEAPNPKMFF